MKEETILDMKELLVELLDTTAKCLTILKKTSAVDENGVLVEDPEIAAGYDKYLQSLVDRANAFAPLPALRGTINDR